MTKKILVVEDRPDALNLLTQQLEILGIAVILATDSREGVKKAFEEKPDLILMDILMPGMDGREATRRIRSNPKTKDIPLLAATVLNRESERDACIEAGCNDYIVKPFTFEELREKIQTVLDPGRDTHEMPKMQSK